MIFTPRNKVVDDINLYISNTPIHRVYVTKFLGVQIDSKLSWNEHVDYICKKLSKCVAIFYKARRKLPHSCLISLYYSIAYPYFIYCNHVWGNNYKTVLEKLMLVQKKIIRIITCSPYRAHTEPLFVANQLLTVYDINVYTVGIFMYNTITSDEPTLFTSFFIQNDDVHEHATRTAQNLHLPPWRINIRKFNIRYNGAIVWNSLPAYIKQSQSLMIFKRVFRKYLIDLKCKI